jgi:hypothetical protein
MSDYVSVTGPVEVVDGHLAIRIPLAVGGDRLAPLARGIGAVEGDCLVVVIQPWLAEKLQLQAGSRVVVDNRDGLFTITGAAEDAKA